MGSRMLKIAAATAALLLAAVTVQAADYPETIAAFKEANESQDFFKTAYAYAVFPTVGEAGLVVGGAWGKGRVYVKDVVVGDSSMKQVSAGLQAGGKAYSQIIFFQDKRALDEFESGSFEFSAGASAIAITAAAGASAGTNGVQANASGTANNAATSGVYNKGMAVFVVAKGGLMYSVAIAGQKFTYKARGAP